jgi:hypothetical protein
MIDQMESWRITPNVNQSALQCNGNIPVHLQPESLKVTQLPGKVMLTMFWNFLGVLLAHFQKCGINVNSASYCEVLLKLQDAICRKCPGQWARRILLCHENARPHTAQATLERIQEIQWELLEHTPYSPDFGL